MAKSEIAAIEAMLTTYLDGLHEGDVHKLGAAFHPCAHLFSAKDGGVVDVPRAAWFDAVQSRPKPSEQGLARHDRIISIDMSGPETALVKLNCAIPPRFFTDYLMLLKTAEGWKIVSKSFHVDTQSA